jgi:glycosyl transferase family 1
MESCLRLGGIKLRKQRIAFVLSDLSYPPREGLHQQSIYTIKSLKGTGADLSIFGLVKAADSVNLGQLAHDEGIEISGPLEEWNLPHVVTGLAVFLGFAWLFGPLRRVKDHLTTGRFDAVHFDGVAACGFARTGRWYRAVASVIDPPSRRRFRLAGAAASLGVWASNFGLGILGAMFEFAISLGPAICHVVSRDDGRHLAEMYPRMSVAVIPVQLPPACVDRPVENIGVTGQKLNKILIFADLRVEHMAKAVEAFFLRMRLVEPDIKQRKSFLVLGRVDPNERILELGASCGATFETWVEDYVEVIDSASLIILPDLVGTGVKNRTIQSMARGRAVIGTSAAFQDTGITPGVHGVICCSVEQLVKESIEVSSDPQRLTGLGTEARRFVLGKYSSAEVGRLWGELYER